MNEIYSFRQFFDCYLFKITKYFPVDDISALIKFC